MKLHRDLSSESRCRLDLLQHAAQICDPFASPMLTLLTPVDIVRRFNSCLPFKREFDGGPGDPVSTECTLLKDVAMRVLNK